MFPKASLTIAVSLALLFVASPVQETGVRVPFVKRQFITDSDGVFNHEEAIKHNVRTHKYVAFSCSDPSLTTYD